MKRISAVLLFLFLSGCAYLPFQPFEPTPACPNGICETAIRQPTTLVMTPTEIPTQTTAPTETPSPSETPEEATPTSEIAESETPFVPTGMVELTSTATSSPSPGPSPTLTTDASDKFYVLQEGTPRRIQNFARASAGCQWMGIAGQVFGAGGVPMKNMVVVVTGELNGEQIDAVGLTGLDSAYGPGGYEIQIANHAVASTQILNVQLFDLNGMELTIPYAFDTSDECTENLLIINFVPNL